MNVFVRDDLFQTDLDECGDPLLGRVFYVVVEDQNGARIAHDRCFYDHRRVTDEDGFAFWQALSYEDVAAEEAKAKALAAKIESHLARGGALDPEHWRDIDPCYGSKAYADLDRFGYFLAKERAADRDRGENVPDSPWDGIAAMVDGPNWFDR
ncbi:hypothetical protein CcrC1_gp508 [Caulobacter phage C1]|nr:hypothetical protein CcrC1_gp015 [Caulobacter phage C1]UTU08243.1 hypothetical protein CcrC2_gp015 [Caulobacter phage C2]UTU08766.1 hypothetical protein CcrJ4_gp015 [Caulobacter phage J4]UTU09302.1 hypothetical protein CcrBL47_gp016 [Caulobacter phage BL47]UTU09878.1 hypothetical protein CcrRB23_gp016 [Caulobacter phage RB23]WGN96902.1 hypothetical protein [Bertelyvirus sp.]